MEKKGVLLSLDFPESKVDRFAGGLQHIATFGGPKGKLRDPCLSQPFLPFQSWYRVAFPKPCQLLFERVDGSKEKIKAHQPPVLWRNPQITPCKHHPEGITDFERVDSREIYRSGSGIWGTWWPFSPFECPNKNIYRTNLPNAWWT